MQFEDLQVLWNSQNQESYFAIDESALQAVIKSKSRSVNHLLDFIEWALIGVNLIVSIILIVDAWQDRGLGFQYILSAVYLLYFFFMVFRRLMRKRNEEHFPPTMLGELDKAIWRVNYLIQQSRTITIWYVLPLGLVITISLLFNFGMWWGIVFFIVWTTVSYFGGRWEINKWYLPKKQNLEALREKLTAKE